MSAEKTDQENLDSTAEENDLGSSGNSTMNEESETDKIREDSGWGDNKDSYSNK